MWSRDVELVVVCIAVALRPAMCGKYPKNYARRQDAEVEDDNKGAARQNDQEEDVRTEPNREGGGGGGGGRKKGCCPYEFDSSKCRIVNERIQCGYNKNPDGLTYKEPEMDLSGGCKLRNGRIECGYWQPPYANQRRPPPNDGRRSIISELPEYDDYELTRRLRAASQPENVRNDNILEDNFRKNNVGLQQDPRSHPGTGHKEISCVEIDERIVCQPVK